MIKKIIILGMLVSGLMFGENVKTILKKVDQNSKFKTSQMESTMRIIKKGKILSEMKIMGYTKEAGTNDKQLMRFTYPARLNGTAILSKDGNIWYYNKRSNRVRLLSKSAKKGSMMGTGMNYDDMSLDYIKDFDSEILEEKKDYYMIKMTPKDSDKNYKYLIVKIKKDIMVEEKVEYYNKSNNKYKEMTVSEYKKIGDKWVALKAKIDDFSSGKITEMITNERTIKYDINLSNSIFSERNLKK